MASEDAEEMDGKVFNEEEKKEVIWNFLVFLFSLVWFFCLGFYVVIDVGGFGFFMAVREIMCWGQKGKLQQRFSPGKFMVWRKNMPSKK